MLGNLANWMINDLGRKVNRLYFVVDILFDLWWYKSLLDDTSFMYISCIWSFDKEVLEMLLYCFALKNLGGLDDALIGELLRWCEFKFDWDMWEIGEGYKPKVMFGLVVGLNGRELEFTWVFGLLLLPTAPIIFIYNFRWEFLNIINYFESVGLSLKE